MPVFTSKSKCLTVVRRDGKNLDFKDGVFQTEDPEDISALSGIDGVFEQGRYYPPVRRAVQTARVHPGVINWYSPIFGCADGYGSSAEQMILAMERLGKRVDIASGAMVSGQTYLKHIFERPYIVGANRIVYCPPHENAWRRLNPAQRVFGFSMWEDSNLPDCWDNILASVDGIMVPSKFCVELFQRRITELGLEIPVHYVPLGVNADLYPYRQRTFQRGNEKFTVLHCSTGMQERRKGGMIAYEAFCRAFGDQDDVRLVFRARQDRLPINDPRVVFETGLISDEQKLSFYYNAHVLLYPSYGEGFGLIPLEAIASGLPAIVSANSSMLDYADLTYPIQCDPELSGISVHFQRESRGDWMKPRVDDAAGHLRHCYEDYRSAQVFAASAAKRVRKDWSYDRSAQAIINVLEG